MAPSVAAGLAAGLLAAPPTFAGLTDVDLRSDYDIRIDGWSYTYAGDAMDRAGDVNGDGLDDVVIGARAAGFNDRGLSGSAVVVFGGSTDAVNLASLGDRGFRMDGAAIRDASGSSVAGVGDVNGDGYDDLLIGAPGADNNGREAGAVYVVFGGATADVDLGALGSRGFRIDGAASGDASGSSVAGVGDLNGDGRDDLLIGAPGADDSGREGAGAAYVVFGGATADVDLGALGSRGFRIDGAASGDRIGSSVAGARDVNGDGFDDLVLGAPGADSNGQRASGATYVVFGGRVGSLDLSTLGNRGFAISGASADDWSGGSVAGVGDFNGDGLGDLLIGATGADNAERERAGASYLILGSTNTPSVDLASLGARGFRIDGAASGDSSGSSVAGAGDVNGDGLDDLLIGARNADPDDRDAAGASYVIFGGTTRSIDLRNLGARGFRIVGADAEDYSGAGVAGAGDFNGDGVDDVLVGSPGDTGDRSDAYVVFGRRAAATLKVKARKKANKVKCTGRTKLVRKIRVGKGQKASVKVKVLPKKARKTIAVKKTTKRVVVRTKKTPNKTRIRVRIVSRGPGYTPKKWVRTWRVR